MLTPSVAVILKEPPIGDLVGLGQLLGTVWPDERAPLDRVVGQLLLGDGKEDIQPGGITASVHDNATCVAVLDGPATGSTLNVSVVERAAVGVELFALDVDSKGVVHVHLLKGLDRVRIGT